LFRLSFFDKIALQKFKNVFLLEPKPRDT